MLETGITDSDLKLLEEQQREQPERLNSEVDRLLHLLQTHYRKSEPEHYPCLSGQKWGQLFDDDYGHDYRIWHLAFCHNCFVEVADRRRREFPNGEKLRVNLHIQPLKKGGVMALFGSERGGRTHGTRTQRLSRTSA